MKIEVRPFETGFGAEIQGLDLSAPLDDERFRIWNDALERHAVLVFRGQHFTDDQHIAFSRRFGELEDFPDPKDQAAGYPMVLRVSNVDRDTGEIKPVDDAGHKSFTLGTSDWHIDSSFRSAPSKASPRMRARSRRTAAIRCSPIWRWPMTRCPTTGRPKSTG